MLILSGMKSRNSTNVYLVFVATADLVVLSFHLPQHIHDSDESYVYTLSTEAQAKYEVPFRQFDGIQRWGRETAIQLSDWTLLIFSCERLLTSLRPFYFRERCSVNTAIVMECVLLFLCMLSNLYGPVQSYYCLGTPEYASNVTVCIQNTEWLANWVPVEERAAVRPLQI
ncbi:hypothetical protein BV898_09093 [Hypsibius exemplaris]|uniref:G-protein coupled receptors family 1 profile domain-containing protein n=1 Tax=Hypsibius exemplaris TaxID=2072580 RepID=A0A1W0WNG2_HYPEX|nr:hypothetical protein BV898_09093 [Hypsibius exemplaris]